MSERLDVLSPRKDKTGKTRWLKIGAAFPKEGGKFSVLLDALPLPDETGKVMLLMSPYVAKIQQSEQSGGDSFAGMDNDIPF